MPRLKPITSKSDLPPEHQGAADEVVKVFGHIRGPFSMLLHSPGLAARLLPVVPWIREQCIVEPTLRFVAILAAGSARRQHRFATTYQAVDAFRRARAAAAPASRPSHQSRPASPSVCSGS